MPGGKSTGAHQNLLAGRSCQIFCYEQGDRLVRHRRLVSFLRHQLAGWDQGAGDEKLPVPILVLS